jgi:hypothetical protein
MFEFREDDHEMPAQDGLISAATGNKAILVEDAKEITAASGVNSEYSVKVEQIFCEYFFQVKRC